MRSYGHEVIRSCGYGVVRSCGFTVILYRRMLSSDITKKHKNFRFLSHCCIRSYYIADFVSQYGLYCRAKRPLLANEIGHIAKPFHPTFGYVGC